jgi:hypothetical protein
MTDNTREERLNDVLDAFLLSGGDTADLGTWTRLYPEFKEELTDLVAARSLMDSLPAAPDALVEPETQLAMRTQTVLQRVLANVSAEPQAAPIQSLLGEARSHGVDRAHLARQLGLGTAVLLKLDRRLLRFATVPADLVREFAAAIQRDVASVAVYLQQPPTLSAQAAYRAEQAPRVADAEDFAVAVRADPTMTDAQRARWLSSSADAN